MASEKIENMNYRKFRKNIVEEQGSEVEDYFVDLYEKICDHYPSYPEAPFPVGLDPLVVATYPAVVKVGGMVCEGPTIVDLLKKIVVAHEEKMNELWDERQASKEKK
jgi:hypothetical protein